MSERINYSTIAADQEVINDTSVSNTNNTSNLNNDINSAEPSLVKDSVISDVELIPTDAIDNNNNNNTSSDAKFSTENDTSLTHNTSTDNIASTDNKIDISGMGGGNTQIVTNEPRTTEAIVIPVNVKRDRIIKTLFGATIHCKCIINDEVRLTVWILAVVGALAVIGFFVADVNTKGLTTAQLRVKEEMIAVIIAAVFAFVATILSIVQIRDHYGHWVHPPSQRCVVRILMMVPVYSISALASMIFIKWSLYIDFIRGIYEAFVIYQFMMLLTKYLGGDAGVIECMRYKSLLKWPVPFGCLPAVKPDAKFLLGIKYGTLQYTILSPIVSVIAIALNVFDLYGDGEVNFKRGYIYVAFMQNCTQLIALYCLVWLYVVLKNELSPFRPMAKFLVVKSVVFFTFWQSIGLAVLVHMSVLKSTEDLNVGEVQIGLQDFLVCIEMFLAAAAHKYTFGYETYANGTMKLLMDQRAIYIANLHYQRAVEAQQAEEAKKLAATKKKKKKKKKKKVEINEANNTEQKIENINNNYNNISNDNTDQDNTNANRDRVIDINGTNIESGIDNTPKLNGKMEAPFNVGLNRQKSALPGLEDITNNLLVSGSGRVIDYEAEDADTGSALFDDRVVIDPDLQATNETATMALQALQQANKAKFTDANLAKEKAFQAGFGINAEDIEQENKLLDDAASKAFASINSAISNAAHKVASTTTNLAHNVRDTTSNIAHTISSIATPRARSTSFLTKSGGAASATKSTGTSSLTNTGPSNPPQSSS